MCTALSLTGSTHLFGRTLDLEYSYNEEIIITPRRFCLDFLHEKSMNEHSAIIGVGCLFDGKPLYYDAMNEEGLAIAGLNFPGNAIYHPKKKEGRNIASFEVIPFVLSRCKTVDEARTLLQSTRITPDDFGENLKTTPLHWIIADKEECIVVESTKNGLFVYDNPFGALTNNPPFPEHITRLSDYAHLSSRDPVNTLSPETPLSYYSRGMGGIGLPGDFSSFSRFVRTVFLSNHASLPVERTGEISRFFHIMDGVSVPKGCVKTSEDKDVLTYYTSCADTEAGVYYVITHENRRIRALPISAVPLDTDTLYAVSIAGKEDISYLTPKEKRDTMGKTEIN